MTSFTHCCSQEMSLKGQKTVNYSFANEATLYVVLSNVKRLQNLLFNTRGHCVLLHLLCKTLLFHRKIKTVHLKPLEVTWLYLQQYEQETGVKLSSVPTILMLIRQNEYM